MSVCEWLKKIDSLAKKEGMNESISFFFSLVNTFLFQRASIKYLFVTPLGIYKQIRNSAM